MKFLSKSKKIKNKKVIIFDIGSGSVAGAVALIPLNKELTPTILKSVRNEIKFRRDLNFNDFVNDMTDSLYKVANLILNEKLGAPDEIFCVLASPWYISENKVIKIEKSKKAVFKNKNANKLIKEETARLTNYYKKKYGEDVPKMIEQYILSVSLDGVPVDNPVGLKYKTAEIDMIMSSSPTMCLDKVKETISKVFHETKVNFSSFTLLTHLALRDRYIKDNSYLLVDVAGEITDIGVVINGILKFNLSFPIGKKTIFKNICNKLDLELRDVQEILKLYSEKRLFKPIVSKIEPIIKNIENSWIKSFSESLNNLSSKSIDIPHLIYLTADNNVKSWVTNVIEKIEHPLFKTNNYKYIVEKLDGSEFSRMCNFAEGEHDPFLMIETIAITDLISYKNK